MRRRITRRQFLVGSGGAAAAWTLLPGGPAGWADARYLQALDRTRRSVAAPGGTTLEATIVRLGGGAYRRLGDGPGEPIVVRTDLSVPKVGREDRREALVSFVHLTDQHLIDAQSPGRVEFLDPDNPLFQSAYRPQELLTTQVATSMVHRINALQTGPVSGRRFDAAVCTGDNVDNQQMNELGWLLAILDGGTVTPDSGEIGRYEGVQDAVDVMARYWHPDEGLTDGYKIDLGYPDRPGLLQRAIAPFSSPGLDIPWFSVYGNHDCNIQGNAARTDSLDQVFTGDRKITAVPPGESGLSFVLRVINESPSVLADLTRGALPFREVTPDATRRTATIHDWISAHVSSPDGGHGYGPAALAGDRLYYEFDLAPGVVGISLDTTNHFGGPNGSGGSIGTGQLAWLETRLASHHGRYLDRNGSVVSTGGDDRLVVVFSHHTTATMDAVDPDPGHPTERRVLGPELADVLVRYPNVVAWVNGHTHTNGIAPHRHPAALTSGFWEISTASHVDWPQQARVLEVLDNADGTLSIFATMIEHAAPAAVEPDAADVAGLAAISRELGANDQQTSPEAKAGTRLDRNVELVLPAPFARPAVRPTSSAPIGVPVGSRPAVAARPRPAQPSYTG
ncbi:MAG: TIGR03767 family metallophosphoesterase [Aquihabitans sp.]